MPTALRVLVVDANADTADTLADVLRLHGMNAEVAYSAQQALQVAADFQPDAVVTDVVLPGMSGVALCTAFREAGGKAPRLLIAHSGVDRCQLSPHAARCFTHYLLKPPDTGELLQILGRG